MFERLITNFLEMLIIICLFLGDSDEYKISFFSVLFSNLYTFTHKHKILFFNCVCMICFLVILCVGVLNLLFHIKSINIFLLDSIILEIHIKVF